jgi:hypothetical protein
VLADADALSSCYGVGEVLLPDILHTVVELGFTSSIRFLQPGLMLHGHSAPHSHGSYEDAVGQGSSLGAGLITAIKGLLGGSSSNSSGSKAPVRQQQGHAFMRNSSSSMNSRAGDYSTGSSPSSSRSSSPSDATSSRSGSPQYYQQQQQQQRQLPPPASKLPRSSWRHRKEIEEAGRAEGLTEWQVRCLHLDIRSQCWAVWGFTPVKCSRDLAQRDLLGR